MPIRALFSATGFHIDRVVENQPGTTSETVRIDFTLDPSTKPVDPKFAGRIVERIASGWMVVSPQDEWAIRSYGINYLTTNGLETTRVGHIEYRKGANGKLEPVKASWRGYKGSLENDPARRQPGRGPFGRRRL